MAELVDAPDLGSGSERSGGSSPPPRTEPKGHGNWVPVSGNDRKGSDSPGSARASMVYPRHLADEVSAALRRRGVDVSTLAGFDALLDSAFLASLKTAPIATGRRRSWRKEPPD